ncbi:Ankyrin_repeat protein [Hexamita inflata]|uniref:Ankyrin repeat protein n=1 Tax=Hexamita inflata TaxID=28002 RepID=A0AA86PZ06_9EUKA|nr:Ankyrin repeat protein [Hexamita inflata]
MGCGLITGPREDEDHYKVGDDDAQEIILNQQHQEPKVIKPIKALKPEDQEKYLFIMNNDIPQIQELLKEYACKYYQGYTGLMLCAQNKTLDSLILFAQHEQCLQQSDGMTALMIAVKNKFIDAIPHLKKEYNLTDDENRTALIWSILLQDIDSFKMLFEHEVICDWKTYLEKYKDKNPQFYQLAQEYASKVKY